MPKKNDDSKDTFLAEQLQEGFVAVLHQGMQMKISKSKLKLSYK